MTIATVASYEPNPESGSLAVIADPDRLGSFMNWSKVIATSAVIPDALRGKPADILVTVLTGLDFGFRPMQAFQWVYVVKGRPSLSAEAMRALLLRDGHDFKVVNLDSNSCTVAGRRKGSDDWHEASFTDDNRKAAKLSGVNWDAYREDMLFARATTRLCKRYFSDIIGGLPSTEELYDQTAIEQPRPSLAQVAADREKPAIEQPQQSDDEMRSAVADLAAEFTAQPEPPVDVVADAEIVVEEPPADLWPAVAEPGSGAKAAVR